MISNQAFNPNHTESVPIRIKADQIFNLDYSDLGIVWIDLNWKLYSDQLELRFMRFNYNWKLGSDSFGLTFNRFAMEKIRDLFLMGSEWSINTSPNNSDSLGLNSNPKPSPGWYWWKFRIEIQFKWIRAIPSRSKISFRNILHQSERHFRSGLMQIGLKSIRVIPIQSGIFNPIDFEESF